MKSLILLFLFCSPIKAAMPDDILDPATRDTVEYLDGKLSATITKLTDLGSVIGSTVTILGILNGGTGAASAILARNNLGVPATDGTGASGTWGINISGNSNTATSANTANTANNLTGYITISSVCANATTCTATCTSGKIMGGDCSTLPVTIPKTDKFSGDTDRICTTGLSVTITVVAKCANLSI